MILEKFKNTYQEMDASNIGIIEDIYCKNVTFEDPFHTVYGLDNLKDYFQRMYKNVDKIEFHFSDEVTSDSERFITWTMDLTHPKLNKGRIFSLQGVTHLKINSDQQIEFHKDYFDGGAMLYERVPLIGNIVRWIKGNL